ncbi:hypothetical protein AB0L59_13455 [Streptomyces sp. NPDC052109]|uniref:hypothetical protein n=1 Tax=Streptomyces sp. NPDC052109 TaxID=3155527 RepID=UPI003415825A
MTSGLREVTDVTPWLRTSLRCTGLLLTLAAALPAYRSGTGYSIPAYGSGTGYSIPEIPAHAAAPRPGSPTGAGHPYPAPPPRPGGPYRPNHAEPTPLDRPHDPGSRPPDAAAPDPAAHADHHGSPLTEPAPVPMPSDSASASYRPAAAVKPTRAGSRAGEGRMRPGRPDGPAAEVEGDDDPAPTRAPGTGLPEEPETADLPTATPTPSNAPDAGLDRPQARNAAPQEQTAPGPVLQILPLGSGLVLIGLGLALAFLGLRLRRD